MTRIDKLMNIAKEAGIVLSNELKDIYCNAFLFGSVSKRCIKEDSDIDILLIGKDVKNRKLMCKISEILEDICMEPEINVTYISKKKYEEFLNNKNSNAFLRSIENDLIRLEDL